MMQTKMMFNFIVTNNHRFYKISKYKAINCLVLHKKYFKQGIYFYLRLNKINYSNFLEKEDSVS